MYFELALAVGKCLAQFSDVIDVSHDFLSYLIIVGQQHGCRAAVGCCDNPEFHAVAVVIRGEKQPAELQRGFVRLLVLGAYLAPIAAFMPPERFKDFLPPNLFVGGRSHAEKPRPKLWLSVCDNTARLRHIFFINLIMVVLYWRG